MSEAKHTPGPWSIDGPTRFGGLRITAPYTPTCTYLIAEASPDCPDDDTMHTNARLIAAAPDLLAACKDAPIMSQYHGMRGFEADRFVRDYEAWREQARAAIAKAEGGAPLKSPAPPTDTQA